MTNTSEVNQFNAMRIVASVTGILVGLTGFEHGFFEILQGNVSLRVGVIDAIGPAQRLWELGTEPAYTLVPNFLVTGILAMIVGLTIIIWSAVYIDRKNGAWILGGLSVVVFLVGGGFAPLVLAVIPVIAATQNDKPLSWWRSHLPSRALDFLSKLWIWVYTTFVILCLLAMIVAILGYPFLWFMDADDTLKVLGTMGNIAFFGLGPLSLITAFAHDSKKL
jgi:hypothetical protein